MSGSTAAGWRCWWPFALLCVLTASRWMFSDAVPEISSTLRSEGWGCALAAGVLAVAGFGGRKVLPRLKIVLPFMFIGAGLLAAPAVGAAFRGAAGESLNRTLALCFIPLIVLVWNGVRAEADSRMTIWPGLAGIGGALLLFPVERTSHGTVYLALLAPVFAVSAAVVCLEQRQGAETPPWGQALLLAGGAAGLAVVEFARVATSHDATRATHWQAILVDAVVGWLTVLSAGNLSSLRYVSRYFVVPVITIVEGLVFLQGGASLRSGAGLLLLVAASVTLWIQAPQDVEDGRLHLSR